MFKKVVSISLAVVAISLCATGEVVPQNLGSIKVTTPMYTADQVDEIVSEAGDFTTNNTELVDTIGEVVDPRLSEFVKTNHIGSISISNGNINVSAQGSSFTYTGGCFAVGAHVQVDDTKLAHAEGIRTIATNLCAHAEGAVTVAGGKYSHAAGNHTEAYGEYSHAEGSYTRAYGGGSHAEGVGVTANGPGAHAEGLGAANIIGKYRADGSGAHSEGLHTRAIGNAAHAEGSGTVATNVAAHAEGEETTASGKGSHAEGYRSHATEESAHAEGRHTTASGRGSHAEGYETMASGQYSHAGGILSFATNFSSYVWQAFSYEDWVQDKETPYYSHGDGSFNINPAGGVSGFWIGETNFKDHVATLVMRKVQQMEYEDDIGGGKWASTVLGTRGSYVYQLSFLSEIGHYDFVLPSDDRDEYYRVHIASTSYVDRAVSAASSETRSTLFSSPQQQLDGWTLPEYISALSKYKWDTQTRTCYREFVENDMLILRAVTNIDLTAVGNIDALKALEDSIEIRKPPVAQVCYSVGYESRDNVLVATNANFKIDGNYLAEATITMSYDVSGTTTAEIISPTAITATAESITIAESALATARSEIGRTITFTIQTAYGHTSITAVVAEPPTP